LSAAVFIVLSLGPVLVVGGRWLFEIDGVPITIPLPGLLLHFLPVVRGIRALSRFDVMVTLSMAVLVGLGVSSLAKRLAAPTAPPRLMAAIAGALGLALLVDYLSAPLPVLSTEIPQVFKAMGSETPARRGSLLDVPLDWRIAKYQYYQTAHRRPLIFGFVLRPAPALVRRTAGVPFLQFFQQPESSNPNGGGQWSRTAARRVTDLLDLDTIVIHGEYLDPASVARARAVVSEYFPVAQTVEEDRLVVTRLRRDHDPSAVWGAGAYDFDFAPSDERARAEARAFLGLDLQQANADAGDAGGHLKSALGTDPESTAGFAALQQRLLEVKRAAAVTDPAPAPIPEPEPDATKKPKKFLFPWRNNNGPR
jgi:hypothetical protein